MKRFLAVGIFAVMVGCGLGSAKAEEVKALKAVCVLSPTKDNKVTGTVDFIQEKDGVRVIANLEGLTPGKHGFHIHEKGDCSAPDGASAKGHFNPAKHDHGAPGSKMRHEGDLGNVKANSKGVAKYSYKDKTIVLEGKDSIIGKGVIVHAGEDDFKTQPTGNAGARVACGVIKLVKEDAKKK